MSAHLRLVLAAAFALLAPALASAQVWPSEMRRKFVDECLASCTADTKFTSVQRAECPPYCECMIKEAQDVMSADDYTALREANAAKKRSRLQERYEALASTCNGRVFH